MDTGYPDNLINTSIPKGMGCFPSKGISTDDLDKLLKEITKSVCAEADEIVSGERQQQYGDPVSNWTHIAEICTPLLKDKLKDGVKLEASDMVFIMIGVKLARQLHKHKRDSLVDVCGYTKILSMIQEAKK